LVKYIFPLEVEIKTLSSRETGVEKIGESKERFLISFSLKK